VGLVARRLAKAFNHFRGSKTYSLLSDSGTCISLLDHEKLFNIQGVDCAVTLGSHHKFQAKLLLYFADLCVLKMNIRCESCQKKVKKM
ncbi:hypothetical protein QQP08_003531, partial [Theobroma cacao]